MPKNNNGENMSKTNSLTSHCGESIAYKADKMFPVETRNRMRGEHTRWIKKFYNKKNRGYLKYDLRKQLENE